MSDNSRTRKLYRNPANAKCRGVCSGIAEYLGFEVWVVRLITISLILLGSAPFVIIAYFVLAFVLDPKPGSSVDRDCFGRVKAYKKQGDKSESDKPYQPSVKEVWRAGKSPKEKLREIEGKFAAVETKIQRIESFVTSKQYQLEKEFKKMA